MENINLNELLDRITIKNNIISILNNFNVSNNFKKGIFIYGNNGIGKTKEVMHESFYGVLGHFLVSGTPALPRGASRSVECHDAEFASDDRKS